MGSTSWNAFVTDFEDASLALATGANGYVRFSAIGENIPDFVPEFWGLSDEHGKLRVIANYNNDIGDFWKYLDHGERPLKESGQAIRFGINYIVYAMSH